MPSVGQILWLSIPGPKEESFKICMSGTLLESKALGEKSEVNKEFHFLDTFSHFSFCTPASPITSCLTSDF